MTTLNSAIMEGTKYESSGAASTARSMVTQRWRSCDMSTIRIPLNSRKYPGHYVLIDAADYELVSQYHWGIYPGPQTFYAFKNDKRAKNLFLHGLLLEVPDGMVIDHINRNGLDNRRENLRIATKSQNQANTTSRGGTSVFKGVQFRNKAWSVSIQFEYRKVHVGAFVDEIAAANAFDIVAIAMHGEYAHTNLDQGLLAQGDILSIEQIEETRTAYSKRFGKPLIQLINEVAGTTTRKAAILDAVRKAKEASGES